MHTIAYSETSVIAKIYTAQLGMQSYMLKGVRKPKSRINMAMLQPLTLIEFVSNHKPNKTLHFITELSTAPAYQTIPYDVNKSTIAFFLAEVLCKSIREEEANTQLFQFIRQHLLWLDANAANCKQFHHYFLVQLTQHLGFFPDGSFDTGHTFFDLREGVFLFQMPLHPDFIAADDARLLHFFMQSNLQTHQQITTTHTQRKTLLTHVLSYYYHHNLYGSTIKTHQILEEIMA